MTCVLLTVSTWYKQTVYHTHIYKLEIVTKCVINELTHNVKIVPSAFWGNEFISLDINATLFAWSVCHCNTVIFIVTNWLSYAVLFTAIAITSLLCYWHIISNFCQTLGTHRVQTCFFEKWGDIVTQYIAELIHHSSLIQQTQEKVVLCNTRSVSKIVNIWWCREAIIYFHFHLTMLTEISSFFIKIHFGTCNL